MLKPFLFLSVSLCLAPTSQARELEPQPQPMASAPLTAPDRLKVSYAIGMQLGLDLRPGAVLVDIPEVAQGLKDVFDGKPTRVQEAELATMLGRARTEGLAKVMDQDRANVSYAIGMHKAMQLRRFSSDVDVNEFTQGMKDLLEGKPTKMDQSEIDPLFQQARAYNLERVSKTNRMEGEAFLAKNAREPGIQVLPSGLQYRVLEAGNGETPTTNDLVILNYRGTFINGREFDRNDHYLTRINGGLPGWQEAMQRMKVGSKMQVFMPPALGFGHDGEEVKGIGPETTLIYELELVTIAKPGHPLIGTGSLGHGLDGEYLKRNAKP